MAAAEGDSMPHRSNTTAKSFGSIRHKISAPVELIHTTNMLSYNAPDIFPQSATSTGSSHRSDDDMSDSAPTTASSPPTSPDIDSPKRSRSPEPNHLSCYFTVPGQAFAPASAAQPEAPIIPARAASHSKKSFDNLVRQRSTSRMSEQSQRTVSTKASLTFSRSSSASTSTSATSHSSTPPQMRNKASGTFLASPTHSVALTSPPSSLVQAQPHRRNEFSQSHPFGHELAQVSELAEEYGVREQLNEVDAEEKELVAKGLLKFSADDYMSEIQGLVSNLFSDPRPMASAMWI